jgi:large subunit ribosomal protein L7A
MMSYEKVLQAKNFVVGTKQTVKALKTGTVQEVILAADADQHILAIVVNTAKEYHVPIQYAKSMKKLGTACGIQVGATAVAIIN